MIETIRRILIRTLSVIGVIVIVVGVSLIPMDFFMMHNSTIDSLLVNGTYILVRLMMIVGLVLIVLDKVCKKKK